MRIRIWFLLLFCWLAPVSFLAQIDLYDFPKDLQLFPRDEDSFARFAVRGLCTDPEGVLVQTLILDSESREVLEDIKTRVSGNQPFEVQLQLKAQMMEYDLQLWFIDRYGIRKLIAAAEQLVAGDIFLVAGQSNAGAPIFDGGNFKELDSLYAHKCLRTIGHEFSTALQSKLSMETDAAFLRPSTKVWDDFSRGFVGVWALKLQHELALRTGIPNCIINLSQGATTIMQHLPKQIPTNGFEIINGSDSYYGPGTLYERLFMKTFLNNINHDVQGIFWYQGESDGNSPDSISAQYHASFAKLYEAWKKDYTGVKRIFLFQINTGCGGENLALIREQQMKLGDVFPDVTVMTTVGGSPSERANDGCHFKSSGYMRLAVNILQPVLKYIYNHDLREDDILPPRLIEAFYSSETEICLRYDKEVFLQDSLQYDIGKAYIRDYFYDKNNQPLPITKLSCSGDLITLDIGKLQKKIESITYLPSIFTNLPTIYDGPWIVSERNHKIGAFPIYKFEIADGVLTNEPYIFPNPSTGEFSISCVLNNFVTQVVMYDLSGNLRYNSGKIETQHQPVMSDLPDGLYTVIITHGTGTKIAKVVINKGN